MNKITPDHLSRSAYVYVRQSTPDQLINNPESRRRQYGLATRARALGWENVIVIDDDLGRSGGGTARPGFERLLAAICTGTAGPVLAIEASRLARNGREFAEVRTLQLAKQMAQAIDLRERAVALADGGLALRDRSVTFRTRRHHQRM